MQITTQIGLYEVLPHEQDEDLLRVGSSDPEALQAAVDGIALLDGGEDPRVEGRWLIASRHAVADWVAFEIRQYVVHTWREGRFDTQD